MKLKSVCILITYLVCIILICPWTLVAAASQSTPEWTNDNAVIGDIKAEFIDIVLENPSEAFVELNPTAVFIKDLNGKEALQLLIVLSESGKEVQQAAIDQLTADSKVASVKRCDEAPFESINTLRLTPASTTIHTGETVFFRSEGELRIYQPKYDNNSIIVALNEFDPDKQYTIEDFPQVELKEIEQYSDGFLRLVLEQSNYYNLIHSVNALALDPTIRSVWIEPLVGAIRPAEFCIASDPSITQFAITKTDSYTEEVLVGAANENGEYILKGLASGKVTVTYYKYGPLGSPYTATAEIIVLDEQPSSTPMSEAPLSYVSDQSNGSDTAIRSYSSNARAPKTGVQFLTFELCVLALICSALVTIIICYSRRRNEA